MSRAELKQEVLYRRWRSDEKAFFREAWFIRHPEGKRKLDLYPSQEVALDHWRDNRYSLTLKARQIGYSTLVAAHAFWEAYFQPDREIIMLSRGERESIKLLRKAWYGYKFLPDWLKERGPKAPAHNQEMRFSNDSSIASLPSASDPARSETAYLVVVDEWAFLPNPEDAWASIEPVADVGGRIIGLSTANGSGNFFATLWAEARGGSNFFKALFQGWDARADRTQEWHDLKASRLPAWQMAQEYPTTEDEAFLKSGNPVFDVDALSRLEIRPPLVRGYLAQYRTA